MALSPQLRQHLKTTPTLAPCRRLVVEAGFEFSFDHIAFLNSHMELFKVALREFDCAGAKRPALRSAGYASDTNVEPQHSAPSTETHTGSQPSADLALEELEAGQDAMVDLEPVGFLA